MAALVALDVLEPPAIVPHAAAILARLEATETSLRYRVVEVPATLEPQALAEIAPGVEALGTHADEGVRRRAVELIGGLEPEALAAHLEALVSALEDEDEDVRLTATDALRQLPVEQLCSWRLGGSAAAGPGPGIEAGLVHDVSGFEWVRGLVQKKVVWLKDND